METKRYLKEAVLRNISLQILESLDSMTDYGSDMSSLVNCITKHFCAGSTKDATIFLRKMSLIFSKMDNLCHFINCMRRDYERILKSSDIMVELPYWFDINDFRPLSEL